MSTRSPSAEPTKVSKRKGTRSVSTLTPSQLARKRANDREAQRAIRARTKEHIERLERELEEYKSRQSRDEQVQSLLRRNKFLEGELQRLEITLAQYGAVGAQAAAANGMYRDARDAVYCGLTLADPGFNVNSLNDGVPAGSGVSSRASSFGNGTTGEYNTTPGFGPSYLPTPEPGPSDAYLPTGVVMPAVPAPSVVSSPCSSTGHPEDYVPGYIPTSVPMMGGSVIPSNGMSCLGEEAKGEFEELDGTTPADHGYPPPNITHSSSAAYLQQPSWSSLTTGAMYPSSAFYSQSPTLQ
ncbi:hypothetical protein B0T14DRAFT_242598 [Immersiella caudata]|uniref:BZIP domain-containing protein n=1 Tax=Immersiella caudata TaxID=314043 RepID=A0AA39WIW7_9PEZI|nr:hypothetical protein B0T14DRAFT_242598 [Immersiella caudata]